MKLSPFCGEPEETDTPSGITPICNAAAVAASTAFADDYSEIFVQLDVARKLEKENAKLRNIAEKAINYLDQSYRDGFCDEASDLRAELNQLKEGGK